MDKTLCISVQLEQIGDELVVPCDGSVVDIDMFMIFLSWSGLLRSAFSCILYIFMDD